MQTHCAAPTGRLLAHSQRSARIAIATSCLLVAGCTQGAESAARPSVAQSAVQTSELQAGPPAVDYASRNPYEGDPTAMQQGRRLYSNMNCAGCHGAEGGGGIGPPLADHDWIYGGQPENIVQAILQGRPNGMPKFGPHLPEDEAWKIATYVMQMAQKSGGQVPSTVGSGAQGANTR